MRLEVLGNQALLLIAIIGIGLRVVSFFLSENAGGDALARAQLTARWLQNPQLTLHFDVWLPLHFFLMAAVSVLGIDTEVSCRLLSLILGIATVPSFWLLVKELGGPRSALFSTSIFSLYSLHIGYSATSSCDVPYLFFVVIGLALCFRGRRLRSYFMMVWAGLALTVAAGIRYEAWIIIAAIVAIMLYRREFKGVAAFLPAAGLWPLFWMIYEWITRGHPLYSPALNYSWVANDLSFYGTSLLYRLLLPPGVILITLTPLAIVGLFLSIRSVLTERGALIDFALISIFFAVVQFYQIVAGGTMSYARYTLTLGMMVAALSGVGLQRVFRRVTVLALVMTANLVALVVVSGAPSPVRNKARSMAPILHFSSHLEDAGKYLRSNLGPNEGAVIDDYNYESNQLAALAGMPLLGSERFFLIPDRINPEKQLQKVSELKHYLNSRQPKYLVWAINGELKRYWSIPGECAGGNVDEVELGCVFRNQEYEIYLLRYGSPVTKKEVDKQ